VFCSSLLRDSLRGYGVSVKFRSLILLGAVALAVLVGAGITNLSPEGASAQLGGAPTSSAPVPVPTEGELQFFREQVDAKDAVARTELTNYRDACPELGPDDTAGMLCSVKRMATKVFLGDAQLACNKAVGAYNQAAHARTRAFPQEEWILVDTQKPVANPLTSNQLLTCGDTSQD
jgi:hypothetical protein